MKWAIVTFLSVASVSCASKRVMTRDEWLQTTQRTYTKTDKEKLIRNAREVLILADGDDFQFADRKSGFTASRRWAIYAIIAAAVGTDFWTFEVEEKDGGLIATIAASATSGGVSGYATGGGNVGAITSPSTSAPYQGTALYDLFWSRLDYLQGLRNDWLDCNWAKQRIRSGETWGHADPLCDTTTAKNNLPNDLSDADVERIFKQTDPKDDSPKYAKKRYLKTRISSHR